MTRLELRALTPSARHATAIVWRDEAFTGEMLHADADRVAAALAGLGLGAGKRVALLFGNTPQFAVGILAAMKMGASAVLLGARFTRREIADSLRRTGAAALLGPADAGLLDDVAGLQPGPPSAVAGRSGTLALWQTAYEATASDDECIVQFTSGTTGRSKIVPRTTANLADELENFASYLGLGPDAPSVCPVPLCHAYGLVNGLLLPLFSGRIAVLLDGWFLPNDVADVVRRSRARLLVGVPVMYKALAETYGPAASDLASLRVCFSAGSPMAAGVVRAFGARYGLSVNQQYGSTETGVIAADLAGNAADVRAVGRPVPGRTLRIVADDGSVLAPGETGEIVVRSAGTTPGYLDDPALNAQRFRDGDYRTGDRGWIDSAGDLIVAGRGTSFINVGGLKVDPAEVEQVLASWDAVVECAVVPAPHAAGGEIVKAVVVARDGMSATDVQRFCRGRLAPHKIPREVVFVDALPRSATGKVVVKYLVQ